MTTWINKIKQLLLGFLATHDNKYIVTDTGKKIVAFDFTFKNASEAISSFIQKDKTLSNYNNINKKQTNYSELSESSSLYSNLNKS